jgi:hypothetical protein
VAQPDALTRNSSIVDKSGRPTLEFLVKWGQLVRIAQSITPLKTAADVSAALDLIAAVDGDLLVRGASDWEGFAAGASGDILASTGAVPVWSTLTALLDVLCGSTEGNLAVRGPTAWEPLAIGGAASLLGSNGTLPSWETLTTLIDAAISGTRGSVLYRGAATWSALAPGSAGNVLTTNGAGADPTWSPGGGGGSSNSPPTPTQFSTTVTAAGTTVASVYTAALAYTFYRTDAGSNNNDRASFAGAAVPVSTPWTVRMQVRANVLEGQNNRAGVGIYDTGSGKSILFGMSASSSGPYLVGIYFSSLTNLSSAPLSQSLNNQPVPEWFKITFDGTTYTFYFSYDNNFWYQAFTATAASYFTATHIGVEIESYNSPWLAMGASCLNYLVP